jgi:succinoglycan biosynthesis transport protein ExoP
MNPYSLAGNAPAVDAELTVREFLHILHRRRHLILAVCSGCVLLAILICVLSTRRYQSVASIQIQKEDSDSLGLESALGSAAEGASDALDYNITLQTQAKILSSDTLALAVIQKTGLEHNDDFTGAHDWLAVPAWMTRWQTSVVEDAKTPLELSPGRRGHAVKAFAKHLKIEIEPGTRIINISFLSTDPKTAADVVNCLIREFTEYTYKTRFAATAQVSEWLSSQLHGLQVRAEEAQAKKVRLQTATGLFGDDDQHNVVLTRLDELSSVLTKAEQARMMAQALDHVTSSGDPDLIDSLGSNSSAASGTMTASLALLQQLRARQAEVQAQVSQSLAKYGVNYPQVAQQQAELKSVQQSVEKETKRITASAHREYQVAQQVEDSSRQSLQRQMALIATLGKPTLAYTMAKQEADSSRDLYESLSTRLTAASVLSGLKSSNVTVIDPGRVSSRNHPKQPNIPVTLAAGVFLGMVMGSLLAFVFDSRDTRLHSVIQIEQLLGFAPLAILPIFKKQETAKCLSASRSGVPHSWKKKRVADAEELSGPAHTFASLDPESSYAEALRSLRTSLMLSRSQGHPKVILITSALPGEGKSTTALNFATILGQQGGRVLIVDGDLRRPTLHQKLRLENEEGLSSLLSLEESHSALRALPGPEDIWVLTTGPKPPYPAELLGSVRMDELLEHWRANFDFILIDTPPVLPVTDAVLLSGRVDAVLMVARYRVSTRHALVRAYQMLANQAGERKVSVILNGVERLSADFNDYYGREYHYGADSGDAHAA